MIQNQIEIDARNKRVAYRQERTRAVLASRGRRNLGTIKALMARFGFTDTSIARRLYKGKLLTPTQMYRLTTT